MARRPVNDGPGDPGPTPLAPRARPWTRWQNWGNVLLGAWLFVSPWVLNFAYGAASYNENGASNGLCGEGAGRVGPTGCSTHPWNAWIVGGVIFLVALWALATPLMQWPEWINMAAGVWLFISPWVLGDTGLPREAWNAWAVGVVVFFLALWALIKVRQAQDEPGPLIGFLGGKSRRPVHP